MAIQTIKDKATGLPIAFQAQVRVRGQKSASATFKTYEKAEEFERNTLAALRSARQVDETRRIYERRTKPVGVVAFAAMRAATVIDEFCKENPDHNNTPYGRKLKELVGEARVADLDKKWTKRLVERMRSQKAWRRKNNYKEATIGNYIRMISRACSWKADELGVERPRLGLTMEHLEAGWNDGRERRLRDDEERRIRESLGLVGARKLGWAKKKQTPEGARGRPWPCARHYQLLMDFALETCARLGEMTDLPWSEIDMEREIWTLPANRSKTKRRRKIYLTPRAMEVLRELEEDMAPRTDLVFHRLPGMHGVSNTFREAVKRSGVKNYVFHDLRHDAISRHLNSGLFKPGVLMKMVGHSSLRMTMRYYNPQDEEVQEHMRQMLAAPDRPATRVDEGLARIREMMAAVGRGEMPREEAVALMASMLEAREILTGMPPATEAAPLAAAASRRL